MRGLLAASFLALSAIPSLASGIQGWCLEALEAGDTDKAKRYADRLIGGYFIIPESEIEIAEECVNHFSEADLKYDPGTKQFLTAGRYEESQQAAKAEATAKAEREAAEVRAAAAEAARREEFLKQVEERRLQRQVELAEAVVDACTRLFRKSADEAVLNPICFEHFSQSGLPQ